MTEFDYSLELAHIDDDAILSLSSLVKHGQHRVLLRYHGLQVGELDYDDKQIHIQLNKDIGCLTINGGCAQKEIRISSASTLDLQANLIDKSAIDVTASTVLNNCNLIADKISIQGDRIINNATLVSEHLCAACKEFIDNGKLLVQGDSNIKTGIYTVNADAIECFTTDKPDERIQITTDFAHIHGKCQYQKCELTVNNRLSSDGLLLLDKSQGHIKWLTQAGQLFLCNGTKLTTEAIYNNSELIILDQSQLKTDTGTLNKDSTLIAQDQSAFDITKLLLIKGDCVFRNSQLTAHQIINHGSLNVMGGSLSIPFNLTTDHSLVLENTQASIPYLTLQGQYRLKNLDLQTDLLAENGTGTWSHINLKTNVLDSESETLTVEQSKLDANVAMINSKAEMTASDITFNTLVKNQGQLRLEQARVSINQALIVNAASENQLDVNQSYFNGANAVAWLDNNSNLSQSILLFNAMAPGQVAASDTLFKTDASFVTNRNSTFLGKTTIDAGDNIIFNDATTAADAVVTHAGNDLLVNANTQHQGKIITNHALLTNAPLTIDAGCLFAEKLSAFDELNLKNGAKAYVQQDVHCYDKLSLNEGEIVANNIYLNNALMGDKGVLSANEAIYLQKGADSTIAALSLLAGETIVVSRGSHLSGSQAIIKTPFFYNKGDYCYDKSIYVDTDYLINEGNITSKLTKLDANRFFFNALGSIEGDTTLIDTPVSLNLGSIVGYDRLAHHSLINLNLGIMRSFNADIKNLLQLNFGLFLPAMPANSELVFSSAHLLNIAKLVLMNLFPGAANIINHAFFIIPLGELLYKKISELNDANLSCFDDLDERFAQIKELRLLDVIEWVLAAKTAVEMMHGKGEIPEVNFGPTFTQDSLVSINTGVELTQNRMCKALFDINTGIDIGLQNNMQESAYLYNVGEMLGVNTLLKGRRLINTGDITSNRLNCKFKEAELENGTLYTHHFNGEIDHLQDPLDFIEGKGVYHNVHIDKSIAYKTLDDINLDRSLSCPDVAIISPNLQVSADQNNLECLSLEATEGDVKACANIATTKHLNVKANGNIITDQHEYTANENVCFDAGKSIINDGGLVHAGKNCTLRATDDIHNIGGIFSGGNYLEGQAGGDIENTCIEQDVPGRYGNMKKYTQGLFIGGAGKEHADRGIYLHANGQIKFDAGSAYAIGDIVYAGDKGYASNPRAQEYVAYDHTKRCGLFGHKKSHRTVIRTQISRPQNVSSNGKVIIVSKDGSVTPVATDFITAEGTYVAAKDPVAFYDFMTTEKSFHDQSSLFGITRAYKKNYDDIAIPTRINNPKEVQLVSLTDDVILHGAVIAGPGLLTAEAGGDIIGSVSVENHQRYLQENGFNVALMGQSLFSSHSKPTSVQLPFSEGEPLLNSIEQLSHSNNITETTLNTINTLKNIGHFNDTVVKGMKGGDIGTGLLDYYHIGAINPNLHIGFTSQEENMSWQTPGVGSIHVGSARLNAKGNIIFVGMPVTIDGETQIDCQHLQQLGMALTSSYQQKQSELGFDFGSANYLFDINLSHYQTQIDKQHFQHQTLQTGPLNLHCLDWTIHNADADIASMQGVVSAITIESDLATQHATSHGGAISSSGDIHLESHHQRQGTLQNPSTFTLHEAVDPERCDIAMIATKGGEVEAVLAENTLHYDEPLTSFTSQHGFNLSGNLSDLVPPSIQPEFNIEAAQLLAELCQAVYADQDIVGNYHAIASYYDQDTSARVIAFYNAQDAALIFVFEGTTGLKRIVTDDVDILTGKQPRSYRQDLKKFIQQEMLAHPDANIYFTGHSVGGVEAALASHDFKEPAITFDNPGVSDPKHEYDFSRVLSVQGAPNFINRLGKLIGRDDQQGQQIEVMRSGDQKLRDAALDTLGLPGKLWRNIEDHRMDDLNYNLAHQRHGLFSQAPVSHPLFEPVTNCRRHILCGKVY